MENLTLNKETQINWLKSTPRDREHSLRSFLLKIYISGTKEKNHAQTVFCLKWMVVYNIYLAAVSESHCLFYWKKTLTKTIDD